jgi:hypothetical protein
MGTPPPSGGGNFLTQKIGGLPVWAWGGVVIVGLIAGLWLIPKFFGGGTSSATPTADASGSTDATGISGVVPNTGGVPITQLPISTGPQGPAGPPGTAGWAPPPVAFRGETYTAHGSDDLTLGEMAQNVYGNSAYWELIAHDPHNHSYWPGGATSGTRAPLGKPVTIPSL